eukprot:TRINITY_DN2708_c0_g1_i1.p1 TRINITY_DN2708_c0_g1~~TRINITY_DN2708_c0_g1_i1.p1  ORF type:complete len:276 (+),score=107.02 TRINITY_DN2708_c0_g1_i1:92-919(+)
MVDEHGFVILPDIRYWNHKGSHGVGDINTVQSKTHVPWQALLRVLRGWKKNPVNGWFFRAVDEWPQNDGFDVGSQQVPRHYRDGSPGRIRGPQMLEAPPSTLQRAIQHESGAVQELFHEMDVNGNGRLSLAEIDKYVSEQAGAYNHKPVLIRAMKLADREGNHDGLMELKEFSHFIEFLSLYTDMWKIFESVDTGHDRRINRDEFVDGIQQAGVEVDDPDAAFAEADRNGGGELLFDEFCFWLARKKHVAGLDTTDGLVGYQSTAGGHVGAGGDH